MTEQIEQSPAEEKRKAEAERDALIRESGDRRSSYWRGFQSKAKQARLLELNETLMGGKS